MHSPYDLLVIVLVFLNFRLLGASQLDTCVTTVALQALVIGILSLFRTGLSWSWMPAMVVLVTLVKAVALPGLVRRAMRETGVVQEIEPFVGYTLSLLLGTGMLVLCFLVMRPLRVPHAGADQLLVPVTLFTMLTGLFLIVARRKAITQVLGFLTMENSIYLFGVAFAIQESWLVQAGVLLDVFAAVFVMGIMIHHINREFDNIDTDQLSSLRD
ncbi:MAG: NADH-quinone oxidoreductase subunit K [Thermodesulfobacteriota bacterium]